jgi:hypothetical protein
MLTLEYIVGTRFLEHASASWRGAEELFLDWLDLAKSNPIYLAAAFLVDQNHIPQWIWVLAHADEIDKWSMP